MKYVSCQTNQRASLDHIAQHIACVSTCCSVLRRRNVFSCLVSENNKYFSNEATKGGGKKKCRKGG